MTAEKLLLPVRVDDAFVMAPAVLRIDEMSGRVVLSVEPPDLEAVEAAGHDLVDALTQVRSELERQGALLWVNGARRNVHASGMLRGSGDGRLGYVMPAQRTDQQPPLVDLLEGPPPTADVVTLAVQDAWFRELLDPSGAPPVDDPPVAESPVAESPVPHTPPPAAVQAARERPGGWVYDIEGDYGPDDAVPPSAIRGAWQVDQDGSIVGDFRKNPQFGLGSRPQHGARPVDDPNPGTDNPSGS